MTANFVVGGTCCGKDKTLTEAVKKRCYGLYLSQDGIKGGRILEGFEKFVILAQLFLPPGFDAELIYIAYGFRFALLLDVTLADVWKHPQE